MLRYWLNETNAIDTVLSDISDTPLKDSRVGFISGIRRRVYIDSSLPTEAVISAIRNSGYSVMEITNRD